MHKFLRAVGFSEIKTKKQVKDLLNQVIINPDSKDFIETDQNSVLIEYSSLFSDTTGIILRGEYDEGENLTLDFFYPFLVGRMISTTECAEIERHAEKESFGGILDDNRIGVSLIFYLQNGMEYMRACSKNPNGDTYVNEPVPVYFSGLSTQGMVMLPIKKNEKERKKIIETANARTQLIEAARHGDETALENLTLDEIDTYTVISKKILKEDIFTLVDTYFMPYGIECDQYSILGEIEEVVLEKNRLTQEEIYVLGLNCNGMMFTICINKLDLMGEPLKGRRFKGKIWLQGRLEYKSL